MMNKQEKLVEMIKKDLEGYNEIVVNEMKLNETRNEIVEKIYKSILKQDGSMRFLGKVNIVNAIEEEIENLRKVHELLNLHENLEEKVTLEKIRRENDLKQTRLILEDLENYLKENNKTVTQKYKIMFLFSFNAEPKDIAEVLGTRFQVVRRAITDELGMGLKEFKNLSGESKLYLKGELYNKYRIER